MTIVGWTVYAIAIVLLLAPAAWLLEHGLARIGLPTRWVWSGSMALCVVLPVAAAVTGPSGPDDVVSISGTIGEVITMVPSAGAPAAEPGGAVDALIAAVARWRAELDRIVAAVATALVSARPSISRWVGVAWGSASLLLAAFLVGSALTLSRRARGWPRRAHLGREVRLAPQLGPATLGLVHPMIVLPAWAASLPAHRLELILTHEEEHARARDPLLLAVGLACVVAFPWNPVVWWQHRRLRDAVEVDCDRRVLRRGAAPPSYGDLLLWMGSRRHLTWLPATTMTGSRSLLERRLTAMRTTKLRAALPRTIGATVVAGGLVVVACTTEPPVAGNGPQGPDPAASVQERNPGVADVWIEPDGRVFINDELHTMEDVSEVIGRLEAASGADLVVSLQADPGAPYGVMHDFQQQLRASGVPRVVFTTRTAPLRTPPGELSEVLEGLALVLPGAGMQEPVSGRNLLHLVVRPSGVVEVRRGVSTEVQRVRAADIEALWRQEVASNPRLIAAVKVHRDADYTHMVEVLDALHAAEARRISIQVLAEQEVALR
jgi:beta-lactamase regulating signal transducer with metallopeptidase domain